MKYYVVLKGRTTGIFTNRDECKRQVDGFLWAQYKSFSTEQAAQFARNEQSFWQSSWSGSKWQSSANYLRTVMGSDFDHAICTDAACPSNPGPIEYRGVDIASGKELFSYGPYPWGSVNIAEFLAIVEGMKYIIGRHPASYLRSWERNEVESKDLVWGRSILRQDVSTSLHYAQHDAKVLYSDSKIAISRIQKGKINTQIVESNTNRVLFEKVTQAEDRLKNNPQRSQTITLKKRPTSQRGQIPADFGRK